MMSVKTNSSLFLMLRGDLISCCFFKLDEVDFLASQEMTGPYIHTQYW